MAEIVISISRNGLLTVDPGADVKVGDTWNFFIIKSVRGGQGE